VATRRAVLDADPGRSRDAEAVTLPEDGVGVALSGGGIRSATFCLGVFRALARAHLVRRIDFLSTVSGGGYFGSFFGALFVPRRTLARRPAPDSAVDEVEAQLLDLHSKPVEWLRENGRYMSPNGAGDTLLAGAVLLRNWVAVFVVIGALAVTVDAAVGVLLPRLPGILTGASEALGALRERLTAAGISASPALELPIVLALVLVVPLALGYWFTQRAWPFGREVFLPPFVTALVVLPILVLWWSHAASPWGALTLVECGLATFWWGLAWTIAQRQRRRANWQGTEPDRLERNRLSRWLSVWLWITGGVAAFAIVDSAGRTLASGLNTARALALLAPVVTAIVGAFGILQKALPLLDSLGERKRLSLPPQVLLIVAAFVVGTATLVGLTTLTHWLGQGRLAVPLVYGACLTLAFAWTLPFLNLSSHNTLYAARLTRAYLGASNPARHDGRATISETIPGDGLALADYRPFDRGGPLHLVNVTLNETVSGRSQIEQRDRKGLPLAVGPSGVSVGSRHHATWAPQAVGRDLDPVATAGDFHVFPRDGGPFRTEELGLGEWISISGAAFSTGVGARTNLALSLLLGLANVRLGYWWNSGIDPGGRRVKGRTLPGRIGRQLSRLLPVYAYFLNELLARFHGPARRRWYLSDGGHFENTGAYELLRRRVPFILLCDDGCDPQYEFADLANLVRKARLDFDAEVVFYPREVLADLLPPDLVEYFGAPGDFRPLASATGDTSTVEGPRTPHALLAAVFYDDPERRKKVPDSVLVILKPGVSGDEPLDVAEYGRVHPAFPQESTMDQFFDEAQWESYRRLGEHVASRVFGDYAGGAWRPRDLTRPPATEWPGTSREAAG